MFGPPIRRLVDGFSREPGWRLPLASALVYAWTLAWILSRAFPGYPPGNDSCYYLVSALGFASGQPYRDLSSPDPDAGALLGPSFFPLLLSAYWLYLAPGLSALKAAVAAVISLAPVLAFHWLRIHIPAISAFLIALAFGSTYTFIVQGNSVMTESVFCPMLYAALLLSHRALSESPSRERPRGSAAAMAAWVVLSRTRVVGWFFLGAFALQAARRRRWGTLLAGAGMAAAWLGAERWMARGVEVLKYTNGVFTRQYPILVDPWKGVRSLAGNLGDNLWAFASAMDAHMLFPFLYESAAMNRPKRLACLAVFLWCARGAWLVWRRRPALRPWLAAMAASASATFLIFQPHDNFRYLMPYFPLLALFFIEPFLLPAGAGGSAFRRRLPAAAGLFLLATQAFGSLRHDFESEYIDYPRDYAALHDSLAAGPGKPDICLSPDFHYTWLKTGCPSLHMQGRHGLDYLRTLVAGKETWAVCGPRNDYFCERWERQGVVFGSPPIHQAGYWRLLRIERWPWEAGGRVEEPSAEDP